MRRRSRRAPTGRPATGTGDVRRTTAPVLAALGLVVAAPAHASNWLDLFEWACDENADNTATVKERLLDSCSVEEGKATVCDTVSGTPEACNTLTPEAEKENLCDAAAVTLSLSAETGTAGFTVSGTLQVAAVSKFTMTSQACTVTPKVPTPDGGAGTYVAEAGTAKAEASFVAQGTGKVTFLGGTIFSTTQTKSCDNTLSLDAKVVESVVACERSETGQTDAEQHDAHEQDQEQRTTGER